MASLEGFIGYSEIFQCKNMLNRDLKGGELSIERGGQQDWFFFSPPLQDRQTAFHLSAITPSVASRF